MLQDEKPQQHPWWEDLVESLHLNCGLTCSCAFPTWGLALVTGASGPATHPRNTFSFLRTPDSAHRQTSGFPYPRGPTIPCLAILFMLSLSLICYTESLQTLNVWFLCFYLSAPFGPNTRFIVLIITLTNLQTPHSSPAFCQLLPLNLLSSPVPCSQHMTWSLTLCKQDHCVGYTLIPCSPNGHEYTSTFPGSRVCVVLLCLRPHYVQDLSCPFIFSWTWFIFYLPPPPAPDFLFSIIIIFVVNIMSSSVSHPKISFLWSFIPA